MEYLLSEKLVIAIEEAEAKLEKVKGDLEKLRALRDKSLNVDMLWPFKVNVKNGEKFVACAQILNVFLELEDDSSSLMDVKLSTRQIWNKIERPRAGGRPPLNSSFRGYLSQMKKNKLLTYDKEKARWGLTQKSLEMLK